MLSSLLYKFLHYWQTPGSIENLIITIAQCWILAHTWSMIIALLASYIYRLFPLRIVHNLDGACVVLGCASGAMRLIVAIISDATNASTHAQVWTERLLYRKSILWFECHTVYLFNGIYDS